MRHLNWCTWTRLREESNNLFKKDFMNKLLLAGILMIFTALSGQSQCTPDYDFGDVGFGVSPDPLLGESFDVGVLGEAYEDIVHILVPTNAGDIDTLYNGIAIDSLSLVSIQVEVDGNFIDLSAIGLDVHCNNNGDSPNECSFLGGEQYCALIDGTPTLAGEFPLTINVMVYGFIGIVLEVPYSFSQYTLIVDETASITSSQMELSSVGQNIPNPFSNTSTINYEVTKPGDVNFQISNLLGEIVFEDVYRSNYGQNSIEVDASDINDGIYLYSLEVDGKKFTRRMVVNK